MKQITDPIAVLTTITLTALSGQAITDHGDLSASLKIEQTLVSEGTVQDANTTAIMDDPEIDSAMGLSIGYETAR